MDTGAYRFADLEQNRELLQDIHRLESKMQQELGKHVALIAYAKEEPRNGSDRAQQRLHEKGTA